MSAPLRRTFENGGESGHALMAAIVIMMLLSAMLLGFMAVIRSDQVTGFSNRAQTTAYAAAHAGLEQLTSDLGQLFAAQYQPTAAQVNALMATPPAIGGVTFVAPGGGPGYIIAFNDANGDGLPDVVPGAIAAGPFQGLQGLHADYRVEATARTDRGGEARMRRTMQTVLIPAFQFGIYSDSDLSFYAGPPFDFGGRVHTNGNLFLASGSGSSLKLRDRVTVVGEMVRENLSNGHPTAATYPGTVNIIRFPADAVGYDILPSEGSWAAAVPQLPPAPVPFVTPAPGSNEPTWTTLSMTATNGNIRNARTGARPLQLPLSHMGSQPIELIRRPVTGSNENTTNPHVFGQRYYSRASMRILLSDTAADITTLPGISAGAPFDLSTLRPASVGGVNPAWYTSADVIGAANTAGQIPLGLVPPHPQERYVGSIWLTGAPSDADFFPADGSWQAMNTPVVTGFIKIDIRRPDGTWVDVTSDVLALGFTGRRLSEPDPTPPLPPSGSFANDSYYLNDDVFNRAPAIGVAPPCANPSLNAVIRLQRVREDHTPIHPCGVAIDNRHNAYDFVPMMLFDPREGNLRDENVVTGTVMPLGGVMHYVELDVTNLARWFSGAIGAGGFGPQVETSDGGYAVYFSDRRTNARDAALKETGEYGVEDIVNAAVANGLPDGVLEPAEDVNGIDRDADGDNLDMYGQAPPAASIAAMRASATVNALPMSVAIRPWDTATRREARANAPLFFRRALKLTGGAGTPANPAVSPLTLLGAGLGLTVVAENPVYVEGNYNTGNAGGFGASQNDHRPAAVIADAVTLLSNAWNDLRSFATPQNPDLRDGTTSWYRMGIVGGKGLSFQRPAWGARQDFGTDGGAHNFLRYIEDWAAATLNYRGSILSFYTSRQGTGVFKCCRNVYVPPTRAYDFDSEFLTMTLLPPKSPAFRDVNALSFRQVLRPTQ